MPLDINERVSKNEQRLDHHEKLLESQMDKNETLSKLATLFEVQMKESKEREVRQEVRDEKQNKQMKEFGDAMNEVVVTLTRISNSQEKLGDNQQQLGNRVSNIESSLDSNKIDIPKLITKFIVALVLGVPAIILTYLAVQLGLK